jgi:hypothetical protein
MPRSIATDFDRSSVNSSTSTLNGGLRVSVVLFNSTPLAIPVDGTTSFEDLEGEALRRAARIGIAIPRGEYQIRLDSANGPLAFPSDLLAEMVDLSTRPTLWLQIAGSTVSLRLA